VEAPLAFRSRPLSLGVQIFALWEKARSAVILGLLAFVATFFITSENRGVLAGLLGGALIAGVLVILTIISGVCTVARLANLFPADALMSFATSWAWVVMIFAEDQYPELGSATMIWGVATPGLVLWFVRALFLVRFWKKADEQASDVPPPLYPKLPPKADTPPKSGDAPAFAPPMFPATGAPTAYTGFDHPKWASDEEGEESWESDPLARLLSRGRTAPRHDPWAYLSTEPRTNT
jgi:hypothetical protein